MVDRFTLEIQFGTGPRIDLHRIALALEMAFQSHPSRGRSESHPANRNFVPASGPRPAMA